MCTLLNKNDIWRHTATLYGPCITNQMKCNFETKFVDFFWIIMFLHGALFWHTLCLYTPKINSIFISCFFPVWPTCMMLYSYSQQRKLKEGTNSTRYIVSRPILHCVIVDHSFFNITTRVFQSVWGFDTTSIVPQCPTPSEITLTLSSASWLTAWVSEFSSRRTELVLGFNWIYK